MSVPVLQFRNQRFPPPAPLDPMAILKFCPITDYILISLQKVGILVIKGVSVVFHHPPSGVEVRPSVYQYIGNYGRLGDRHIWAIQVLLQGSESYYRACLTLSS